MELRATGGFLGSYGRVRVDRGEISLLKIEDIYTPDGQLDGHVDPPWPIQAAFGQGWWKLRDSNFDPDFVASAKTMEWFFTHGKEPLADGIVAVNLSLLHELLHVTGPVYVIDEPENITVENFYKKTQTAVENGFFPGSVQKQTFLSKLGNAVFADLLRMPFWKKARLPFLALDLLKEKQIFVFSHESSVQSWFHAMNFDGGISDIRNTADDYFSFFESNLGTNKANCCMRRNVSLVINKVNGSLQHDLTIHYDNTNPIALKQPPQYWGGAYVNFLRIGIPINARVVSIKVGNTEYPVPAKTQSFDVEKREDKGIKFIGFFALVDALSSTDIHVLYALLEFPSGLVIQKQSGIDSFPLMLMTGQMKKQIDVATDLRLGLNF